MENKQIKEDEVFNYSKKRFQLKNEAQTKKHPMISSMRKKADERYLNLLKKYYNPPNIQTNSIFHLPEITMRHKLLYQADKYYYKIKDYLSTQKMKADRFAIMSNIHLENYLGKLNQSQSAKGNNILSKKQNFFIKHLTIGLKSLAMIKPDDIISSPHKIYSIKPMIYSTLTSNLYHSIKKSLGLSNMNRKYKLLLVSSSALPLSLIYLRYQLYKRNDEKKANYETTYNDIIMHTDKYNKLFNIFSPQEDQMYLKYCQEENMFQQNMLNRNEGNQKMIKLLVPFGFVLYSIYNPAFKQSLVKKIGVGIFVFNELFNYYLLAKRVFYGRLLVNQKIKFYQDNVVHSYDLKP